MKLKVISGQDLDRVLASAWRDLQLSNPDLVSPFFCPEFTRVISSVQGNVEVAVVEEQHRIVAFFPFQRLRKSLGAPVGGFLSDYQGVICSPDFVCNPSELLRQCSLSVWDFDHLLASQSSFAPFHHDCGPSPQMDLSSGYEAYVTERRSAGSEQIKKCGNLMRRMEREIGELRFVSHTPDVKILEQVLSWKSRQFRETSKQDLFLIEWVHEAVERIHSTQEENFGGTLSVLYAGEQLVAGHFGMRSQTVWHYWFPAYNPEMAKYSPGVVLLLKMAQHAQSIGLRTIDLGKGLSPYKERLMNASVSLASGFVGLPSYLVFRRGAHKWLRDLVTNSFLATPSRTVAHWARNW